MCGPNRKCRDFPQHPRHSIFCYFSFHLIFPLENYLYTQRPSISIHFPLSCPANSFENIYKKKEMSELFLMEERNRNETMKRIWSKDSCCNSGSNLATIIWLILSKTRFPRLTLWCGNQSTHATTTPVSQLLICVMMTHSFSSLFKLKSSIRI